MYYFKNLAQCELFLSASSSKNNAKGQIDLTKATKVNFRKSDETIIEIHTPSRKWQLKATNVDEAKQWFEALSRAITQSGNLLPTLNKRSNDKLKKSKQRNNAQKKNANETQSEKKVAFDWDGEKDPSRKMRS